VGVVGASVLGVVFAVKSGQAVWLFASLPFALVLFVVGRFAPAGYRLAPDGVRIERRIGAKLIPYRRIRSVDTAPRPVNGITLGGSKGVFGRFGWFWNGRLGFYRLYVTDRTRVVWLATEDGWVGLSPDRPEEFVARLRARL
jgi:hypothetical protein